MEISRRGNTRKLLITKLTIGRCAGGSQRNDWGLAHVRQLGIGFHWLTHIVETTLPIFYLCFKLYRSLSKGRDAVHDVQLLVLVNLQTENPTSVSVIVTIFD